MDTKIGGVLGKPVCSSIVLAAALLAMSTADAAGLGRLNVLSDLGQPLKAEIDIVSVDKGELESLRAKLAPIDSYLQNNLPYPSTALGLQLNVEMRPSGAPYIVATTVQPVNEPFVDLLVELTWNGGSILRAYTALLDPPTYNKEEQVAETPAPEVRPAPIAAPDPVVPQPEATLAEEPKAEQAAAQPEAAQPAQPPEQPQPRTVDPSAVASGRETVDYTVKQGDTLAKIARQHMGEGVNLDQMLVLLFKNNPEAFSGSNMNRLKAGRLIKIPGTAEAAAVDVKEARGEVRIHTANFNAYREQLAAAAAENVTRDSAGQSAEGGLSAQVEDKAAAAGEAKEVLKLSKGETGSVPAAGQERVRNLEEELAARQKTIAEQSDRIAMLDKQVKDMQALLEMKSKGMANLEKSAGAADKPAVAEPSAAVQKPAEPAKPLAEEPKPAETPAPVAAAPAPLEPSSQPEATATEQPAEVAPPVAKTEPKKPKVVEAPVAAPGLMDQVLGEPLYLGAGAAVLGLLGFLGFRSLRKRKAEPESFVDAEAAPAEQFNNTLNQEVSAAGAVAPAQVSEEVDPLAEADIYLAYGRDAQAEEILKEAMQGNPRRPEVHLKLLEIYAKRKDVNAFDAVARELATVTGEQGEVWAQALKLGFQVDPQNPRYAAGKADAGVAAVAASAAASAALDDKLDFDIGLEDSHSATKTDIDLNSLGSAASAGPDIDLSKLSEPTPVAAAASMQDPVGALDLDLGRTETLAAEEKPAKLDFDFDLSTLGGDPMAQTMVDDSRRVATAMAGGGNTVEAAVSEMDFDLSKLGLDESAMGKVEPMLGSSQDQVDLSAIDLSLDKGGAPAAAGAAPRDDHWYDVQTKFDLAKAYQEMGDKEGAREILREVISEGDDEQQAAAQRVLETLA